MNHNMPNDNPELVGKEAISVEDTIRLLEAIRALLPEASVHVIDITGGMIEHEASNGDDALSVTISADSKYEIEHGYIELKELDVGVPGLAEVVATMKQEYSDGELMRELTSVYGVSLSTLSTHFSKRERVYDPCSEVRELQPQDIRNIIEQVAIEIEVDEIVGDNILTQERFQELMDLLSKCGPDNRISQDGAFS